MDTNSVIGQNTTAETSARRIDIIWNMTLICPWDCEICCVDAVNVAKHNGYIQIKSQSLKRVENLSFSADAGSLYEQAMVFRQKQGLELNFQQKLTVLKHLDGVLPKIDFSGGDPLSASENIQVMRIACERLGREQVTLTATGASLARYAVDEIAPLISELNFTYDNPVRRANPHRPSGYAYTNLTKATRFTMAGVQTRAECPLSIHNINDDKLHQLYIDLHEAGIPKLLLMRLFPVGRGVHRLSDIPTSAQYRHAIRILREIEARLKYPRIKLQCALKFLEADQLTENPCDCVRESFGLMADGTLLASPWAVGTSGRPLHDVWVLGNLATTQINDILASDKAHWYAEHRNDNFGNCKIFAFTNSKRVNPMERILDYADPLYASESSPTEVPLPRCSIVLPYNGGRTGSVAPIAV